MVLPHQAATLTYQLPRMIAQIADHELLLPSRSLLGARPQNVKVADLLAWLKSVDYAAADGVIVSLDLLLYSGPDALLTDVAAVRERLEIIRWIHRQRPQMPIYAYFAEPRSADLRLTELTDDVVLSLLAEGDIDYLLVPHNGFASAQKTAQAGIFQPTDRIQEFSSAADVTQILLTRHLLRRFGISPSVAPIFSAAPNLGINLLIRAAGLTPFYQGAPRADVVLFVHQPDTDAQSFATFISNLTRTVSAGHRMALVDLARDAKDRQRLLAELRRSRLLDQLYAYAAADDSSNGMALALAQASARLVSAKFLRDDPERLRRSEQAQIEMSLNRWLKAAVYDPLVQPSLDSLVHEQWQADPDNLGSATQRAEAFVTSELRRLASEAFSDLFRHNVHSVLLSNGERAEFRVRAIQRIYAAFPYRRTAEPEIRARVYLLLEGITEARGTLAAWELRNRGDLDARLEALYDEINWAMFDAGAGFIELRIRYDDKTISAPESYTIRSSLKKQTRNIEITAATAQGAFYGLARLAQSGLAGRLRQDFQLAEAPAFATRGLLEDSAAAAWSHNDRLDVLRWMGRVRLNRYYYAPARQSLYTAFSEHELSRLRSLLRTARENFVELVCVIKPDVLSADSDTDHFVPLRARLKELTEAGVRHLALSFAVTNDLSATRASHNAELSRRAYEYLRSSLPQATLTVLHQKTEHDDEYVKQLSAALPSDVLLVWSAADATTQQPELPVSLIPENWPAATSSDKAAAGIIVRPLQQAHIALLPLTICADRMWNPVAALPDEALTRATLLLYDTRTRAAMHLWAATFGSGESGRNVFAPLFTTSSEEINVPLIEQRIGELRAALNGIGITRERGLLRGELLSIVRQLEKALTRLQNDPAYEKLPGGSYRRRSQ